MDYQINKQNQFFHIILSGGFHFADSQRFYKLMEQLKTEEVSSLTIDFSAVSAVDSAALGMLLLLRDVMQEKNIIIGLQGAQGQVEKTFKLSRFDQLFHLK